MDTKTAADVIAGALISAGAPLTDDQLMVFAGALTVCLQATKDEERERFADEIATLKRERDAAQAEAETAYDVCGPMVGKCQACGHEHGA